MLRMLALGLGILTVVFASLALGLGWAETEETDAGLQGRFHVLSVHAIGAEGDLIVRWSEDAFDDQDAIGGLRASGPLWIAGLALLALSVLWVEHALIGIRWAIWPAFGTAAVAAALLVTTVVLLPISIEANHQWDIDNGFSEPDDDLSWLVGLYFGVAAAALALATAVLAFVAAWRWHKPSNALP